MTFGAGGGLSADEYRLLVEQAPILIWRAGVDAGCDDDRHPSRADFTHGICAGCRSRDEAGP